MYMGVLSSYIEQEYTAGFYTDIESESLPKGLNEAEPRFVTQSSIDYRQMHFTLVFKTLRQEVWELLPSSLLNCCWLQLQDIVRRIWEIKEEPDWMLEFRLNAFRSKVWEPWIFGGWAESQNLKTIKKKILETISCRKWQKMEMPEWAHLEMEQIDFQDFAHRVFGKKQRKTHFEVSSPCKSRKAFKEYQNRSPVGHCVLFQTEVKAEEAEPGWGFWKRVADSSSRSVHIFHVISCVLVWNQFEICCCTASQVRWSMYRQLLWGAGGSWASRYLWKAGHPAYGAEGLGVLCGLWGFCWRQEQKLCLSLCQSFTTRLMGLGLLAHALQRLANVAVDAVFDSESIGTTFQKELQEAGDGVPSIYIYIFT